MKSLLTLWMEQLHQLIAPWCCQEASVTLAKSDPSQLQICHEIMRTFFELASTTLPARFDHRNIATVERALVDSLPKTIRDSHTDVSAILLHDPSAKSREEVIYCYRTYFAVTMYRIAHALQTAHVPLLPRAMTECACAVTGIDIHPSATIGTDFCIDHGMGVVIGETTSIGNRVTLYQGVILGFRALPRDARHWPQSPWKRHPTIEDDVTIFANALIAGGDVVIGHHARIGAGVYLDHTVAPYTQVRSRRWKENTIIQVPTFGNE